LTLASTELHKNASLNVAANNYMIGINISIKQFDLLDVKRHTQKKQNRIVTNRA